MARPRLMILVFATLVATLFTAPVFAQCTDPDSGDTVAVGDSPPMRPCLVCRGMELEPLPVHTVCGEDRFECRDDGVYREECTDADGDIECAEVNRAANCPGGHVCGQGDPGYCLRTCEGDADCRDGFECDLDTGSCIALPMADMGSGGDDMGSVGDDMGGPDMGSEPDTGGEDMGRSDGGTEDAGDEADPDDSDPVTESGCSSTPTAPSPAALLFAAVLSLVLLRPRSR